MPAFDLANAEEWDYLDTDVMRPARSSRVCMTCHHFRYEIGRHCVSLLACPIHQNLISQGELLTRRCSRRVAQEGRRTPLGRGLRRIPGLFRGGSNPLPLP